MRMQKSAQTEKRHTEQCRNESIKPVQENQLRELRQIFDTIVVGGKIPRARNPTNVRPPKTTMPRRVRIVVLVGMLMMVTVLIGPPERAALHRRSADQSEEKLHRSRSAESFV